jgi:hypothetical protein
VSGLPFSPSLPPRSAHQNRRTTRLSRLNGVLGLAEEFLPMSPSVQCVRRPPLSDRHIPENLFQTAARTDSDVHQLVWAIPQNFKIPDFCPTPVRRSTLKYLFPGSGHIIEAIHAHYARPVIRTINFFEFSKPQNVSMMWAFLSALTGSTSLVTRYPRLSGTSTSALDRATPSIFKKMHSTLRRRAS